ncbi:MAG: helix-turn-helix transcriptional regulator [Gordonia paraffinivorans]
MDGDGALGRFLRARRDRLTPAEAGITAFPGPRRVPGLRKEELAYLAGLSVDHYSRIEQGRQRHVGPQVRAALARALRLDATEIAHLDALAAAGAPGRPRSRPAEHQRPAPGLLRVMTALDGLPALVLGHRGDVLARTAMLEAVLETGMPPGASFPHWLLTDPHAREVIVNWDDFAEAAVGSLRLESGRRPHDAQLARLIAELRAADPDVARWWDDNSVSDRTSLTKHLRHSVAGSLSFAIETVVDPHDLDQRLVVYTVEPDSDTARALPLLASWRAAGVRG